MENFKITKSHIEQSDSFGPKARYANNIEAIKVLKTLEVENRKATEEEQEILSHYVGWGGAANAFDATKENWKEEYAELKKLLSDEEYEFAKASTLDSFYTPSKVVTAIYDYLVQTGFNRGNLLEPSCGCGVFFGLLPDTLSNVHLYGVEADNISASIAKNLYPNVCIQHSKLEEANIENDFFDVIVGNCPFGNWKVFDSSISKKPFFIHDYFFAKSLALIRPNGLIIMVTSHGTMDKKDFTFREYLAQRAELLGAVRLPKTTFKTAGTDVISDILFLKKREHLTYTMPDWVETTEVTNGVFISKYFYEHKEQIVGKSMVVSGKFGPELSYVVDSEDEFQTKLTRAISNIPVEPYSVYRIDEEKNNNDNDYIVADPNVRNFSYTLVGGELFYRENSIMKKQTMCTNAKKRIVGMIELRDQVRHLIDIQLKEETTEEEIKTEQHKLNSMYDYFHARFGTIGNKENERCFQQDESYYLICSLEELNEDRELVRKSAIFTERTINPFKKPDFAKNAYEAMIICRNEIGKIDIEYIAKLCRKDVDTVIKDLKNVIFHVPNEKDAFGNDVYEIAEEYLSGNIRKKLKIAQEAAKIDESFMINVEALEKNLPVDLEADEIFVQLGTSWVETKYYLQFFMELFDISEEKIRLNGINILYNSYNNSFSIDNRRKLGNNVLATSAYGTDRINGYELFERALNAKDAKIYDIEENMDGSSHKVLNQDETVLATQKLDTIKQKFKDWIFEDLERRDALVRYYNDHYNAIKPREYNGDNLVFPGMNPNIELRKHQRDAIARVLYGGNTILCHVVGAGKTFEIVASVMESKRLGLSEKALIVVPNHLTEQWGAEFLRLYPQANILVATKKDFSSKNRKKFCTKISLSNYDAVIIGHSQFSRIPLSAEREKKIIQEELDDLAIERESATDGFTVKSFEQRKKNLQTKLAKLNNTEQDDVITFEELGITMLCVDEAHYFKNAFVRTKMQNVSGIASTSSRRAMDMQSKCRYMDELTGYRGVVFATGTPISNTITELYVMQRYLQQDVLNEYGIFSFDAWASMFAEKVVSLEITPEGSGFRQKTRLARFNNIPELMNMFKLCADIKVAKQLDLPTPEAIFKNTTTEASPIQKDILLDLSARATRIRTGDVNPKDDNMLLITNDGRKLALDQRVINPDFVEAENSKVNACAKRVFDIWKFTTPQKCSQVVFCDMSVPKKDGSFSIYDSLKTKLIAKGIPEQEIAFIHDAKNEKDKDILFQKVRNGDVRVIIGSTERLGAGTNIQQRLIALHHLDIGWRPSDLEQREGRIIRQGNLCKKVYIYRYITKDTFDSYMWQTVEKKQQFIAQIMTEKSPVRSAMDIDETTLSYAEVKALATGNPLIKEQMELEIDVDKLRLLRSSYKSKKMKLEETAGKVLPMRVSMIENTIEGLIADSNSYGQYMEKYGRLGFLMKIRDKVYRDKASAFEAIKKLFSVASTMRLENFGIYCGFKLSAAYSTLDNVWQITIAGKSSTRFKWHSNQGPAIMDIFNTALNRFDERIEHMESRYKEVKEEVSKTEEELAKPFEFEKELKEKEKRLEELRKQLDLDE